VVHVCNPSILEAEGWGSQVGGQPGLLGETWFQKKKLLLYTRHVWNPGFLCFIFLFYTIKYFDQEKVRKINNRCLADHLFYFVWSSTAWKFHSVSTPHITLALKMSLGRISLRYKSRNGIATSYHMISLPEHSPEWYPFLLYSVVQEHSYLLTLDVRHFNFAITMGMKLYLTTLTCISLIAKEVIISYSFDYYSFYPLVNILFISFAYFFKLGNYFLVLIYGIKNIF
jgi:hypothetical protein